VQDPEPYLKELGTELPCAVTRGATARIDARYRVRVNHEIYFVATPAAKRKFETEPWKYCGMVTDPVSEVRFRPTEASPRREYERRTYFFGSDSTAAVFEGDPGTYAEARSSMVPAPADTTREGEMPPAAGEAEAAAD